MRLKFGSKTVRRAAVLLVLTAVAVRILAAQRPTPSAEETVIATRGDVVESVTVTGKVTPVEQVDLAFERAGTVRRVAVDVGTPVRAGQLLVVLDQTDLTAQRVQAQAAVSAAQARVWEAEAARDSQQAKLAELEHGARLEDLAIKQAELRQAEQELTNASAAVTDTLASAFTAADDAVRVKTAALFTRADTTYQLTYQPCDIQAEQQAIWGRYVSEQALNRWQADLTTPATPATPEAATNALQQAESYLNDIIQFLERANATLTTECTRLEPSLATGRANVSQAREAAVSARQKVRGASQSIAAKKRLVERVNNERQLTAAGPRPEQITAQQAVVQQAVATVAAQLATLEQARASALGVQAQWAKTVLYAPLTGVVTKLEAKVGQSVTPQMPVVGLITADDLEITAPVPESDIAALAVGQTATVTLDAFGDTVIFGAHIVTIDPAETVIDGVPTYRVTLRFTLADPRPKSGMTANLEITTARHERVILLPARAVRTEGAVPQALIRRPDGSTRKTPVTIGARSATGEMEIRSGVAAGDIVVMPTRQ